VEEVELSNGIKALRMQDLPTPAVAAWVMMPVGKGPKEVYAMELFSLAAGSSADDLLIGTTFAEMQELVSEWLVLSWSSAPGTSGGLDWEALLG